MLLDGDQAAGVQRCRIAPDVAPVIKRLLGFESEASKVFAFVFVVVLSGEVVNLQLGMLVLFGRLGWRKEVLFRLQVIVVVELDFAGAKAPLGNPVVNMLLRSQ